VFLADRYEALDPARLHGWLSDLLPEAPGTVLDIGAGSGRGAAWFSGQGYHVIAVEPSSGMRPEGQRLHPDPPIRWINDQLPELSILGNLAISFDVMMLTAVWQHVPPSQRDGSFRKLAGFVRSGGLLAIAVRTGWFYVQSGEALLPPVFHGCLNGAPITSCFGFYPAEPDLIVSNPVVGDRTDLTELCVSARRQSRQCARSGLRTFSMPLALRRR